MIDVVGVVFSDSKRIFYFEPGDNVVKVGDFVVVQTERGDMFGKVETDMINVDSSKLVLPVKRVLRKATFDDIQVNGKNMDDSVKALNDACRIVDELRLNMRVIGANFTFDRKQLFFNFVSDERVDFRELAKRLASIYRTRIELRQIGVRDKAKDVGGIGQCGRVLCCNSFLDDINSVSINMAKNQNLALNPQKINGACGRLMCCLEYENDCYADYKRGLPKLNQIIETPNGKGRVIYVDLFKRAYKVEFSDLKILEFEVK